MAHDVQPDCRYGHGLLVRYDDPQRPQGPSTYAAPLIEGELPFLSLNLGRGFAFEVWKCTRCSYVELHDFAAPTPQAALPPAGGAS